MKQHPVWNALSHITAIGSMMFIVFFCIDRVNPAMDFLGSDLSKWCLLLYCIASLGTALNSAIYLFRRGKAAQRRQAAERQSAEDPRSARPVCNRETQRYESSGTRKGR